MFNERLNNLSQKLSDRLNGVDALKPGVLDAIDALNARDLPTTPNLILEAMKSLDPKIINVPEYKVYIALERMRESGALKGIYRPNLEDPTGRWFYRYQRSNPEDRES